MNSHLQGAARRLETGFTLVEMMVVLLIIGIIVTFAGFSLRGDPWADRMNEEMHRLAALLSLASEEAVLEARELAVRFDPDGYRFLYLYNGRWVEITEDEVLRERTLPKGIELELRLQEAADEPDDEQQQAPQVYILSSGEMTPFRVQLIQPELDYRYEIRADLLGHLEQQGPLP